MENKKVIILGSSRKNGNTTKIVDEISKEHGIEVINLSDFNISYYDYESKNREDDFFPLIKGIIENYDTLIFATPVYWYNMSGIMKVFFDRFSDLIRIEKETGRKLRGKKIGVISNSHENEIEDSFYIPFKKSADYLGMEYLGNAHFNANILNQTTKIELTFI
ncbi:NAD(P)H-dependent oxidoreductase [Flavobacterium sp. Fl-77]|uniref:NAD(P)H-dependent oxidoreductase n=1 Tax=Flavobacterium flavipigmentatum TaxID=2893884 RepID=A0AAJ2SDV8_9FLAO|nr:MULTISPECIES: NAD(P)H-dependent oxidoreductase [unclassified Flavobacterium]MDX6181110.1 NAD(P)H-dependent oxidoreductase [Flavobacterium sp. Fl-33]MDX6184711.1 NAD(P)H-dependent oxidoreductase [Flavobacterium sp. Fl-77]UFH39810.1 flavodoxin family protein [Flavobacterium sp. F-70]